MGPNVHYRVYNNPPLISVLSRLNPFQALPTHFLEIHFNIILPSSPRSSKCSPSFQLPFQNHVMQFTLNLLTYSIKKPRTQLFILREPPPIKRYRPENNRRSVRVPRSSSTDNCRKKLQSLFFFGGGDTWSFSRHFKIVISIYSTTSRGPTAGKHCRMPVPSLPHYHHVAYTPHPT